MSRHNDLISAIGSTPIFCSNLGFGEQGAILSKIKKGIYVCPNIEQAEKMQQHNGKILKLNNRSNANGLKAPVMIFSLLFVFIE